jgi:hypothetical protein
MISVDGATATAVYPTAASLTKTTGADGYATFTIGTTGFAAGDTITVVATSGNTSAGTLTLTAKTPVVAVSNNYDLYATTPGTSVSVGYTLADQWQVAPSVDEYRLQVTRGGTGFAYTTTISSVAVSAGAATFAFTPEAATTTGSATLAAALQKYDANVSSWIGGGLSAPNVSVTVTTTADSMSVSPAASTSVSISYFPSTTSYVTITGTAKNAGSSVVVSGDASSLVFRASSAVAATTSGGITVRAAANGGFTFDVTSLHAGTFTISYLIGATSTTSQLVVDAAAEDSGKSIAFDTSVIGSGSTATVTGTLVDVNGNSVKTSGSATIAVTYVGAGIPIGTMPVSTDANGEFTFTVMTGPNDKGTATVTAVYRKAGASTTAANTLTVVATINVGAASVDTKITIGTYKGYVAVFTKGYAGQKLSVRLASKWHVRNPIVDLNAGYSLLTVNTGAGYVANVIVYIDGVEVKRQTITTR